MLSTTQWAILRSSVGFKHIKLEGEFDYDKKIFKPTPADFDAIRAYADKYAADWGEKTQHVVSYRALLKRYGQDPGPVAKPDPTPAPVLKAPSVPPSPGARVYVHPQGARITVHPDGSMTAVDAHGKTKKTSATPEKLAAGHGQWKEVTPAGAPAFAPPKAPPAPAPVAKPIPETPVVAPPVVKTAAPEPEIKSIPVAPSGKRVPMAFESASVAEVPKYVADDNWVFQQKVDGIRGQLVLEPGKKPWFRSKAGDQLVSTTAAKISDPLLKKLGGGLPASAPGYVIDGEMLDGKWYVFDMVPSGGEKMPWETRMGMANEWVEQMRKAGLSQISSLPTARTPAEKRALWDAIVKGGGEGVVMKRKDSPYRFGSRATDSLKAKVTSTADVVVMERNRGGKDNAVIGLYKGGKLTEIGTVSTLGKEKGGKFNVGDVIEVEYLWAHPDSGSLSQPRIVKARPDKKASDSADDQLRFVNKSVLDLVPPESVPPTPELAPEPGSAVLDPMPYEVSFAQKTVPAAVKSKILEGIAWAQRQRITAINNALETKPEFREQYDAFVADLRPLAEGKTFIAVPEGRIDSILADGRMKTLHEGGVMSTAGEGTGGKMRQGYMAARRDYEGALLDLKKVPAAQRPIYGYVGPRPGVSGATKGKPRRGLTTYGDIHLELKPNVRGRTSVTFGDSLDGAAVPVPLSEVATADPDAVVRSSTPADLYWPAQGGAEYKPGEPNVQYVEAQVYGGVSLDDVAAVHIDLKRYLDQIDEWKVKAASGTKDAHIWEQSIVRANKRISDLRAIADRLRKAGHDVRTD